MEEALTKSGNKPSLCFLCFPLSLFQFLPVSQYMYVLRTLIFFLFAFFLPQASERCSQLAELRETIKRLEEERDALREENKEQGRIGWDFFVFSSSCSSPFSSFSLMPAASFSPAVWLSCCLAGRSLFLPLRSLPAAALRRAEGRKEEHEETARV